MSDVTRTIVMLGAFLGGLAGYAWGIAAVGRYPFRPTLLTVVSVYVAFLLTYACSAE
jgi:hypothetical protein